MIDIVKENQPITGEKIGAKLHVSRAALRADLSILTMFHILDARPKVGYFYLGEGDSDLRLSAVSDLSVTDVMTVPVIARQNDMIYDLIVRLFLEDSSSIYVLDDEDYLCGIVSRKDLLKVTIGGADVSHLPIATVMTRMPNILTIKEETLVPQAAALLVRNEIDSLPVVRAEDGNEEKLKVLGKFSKTIVANLFVEIIHPE
ncbi:helix-turn-helix transcriptional regulator [Streptococcus orisasini]|uniref:helix-turn-helix transcriptional regulator n=1 Tax=Streptococcus orisasini TaxID=1080071 RepID=UPI00278C6C49|nr:helix-turn-helix transcriptional regulator [Streptococcus orisasini]